jgi:hypothetical protein
MVALREVTEEMKAGWLKWGEGRPQVIRDAVAKYNPWTLYRLKSTGQRGTLYSFSEDGTCTMEITGKYNLLTFDRMVFGIKLDDIEECDLPPEGEPVGEMLTTDQEKLDFINMRRAELGNPPLTQSQLDALNMLEAEEEPDDGAPEAVP